MTPGQLSPITIKIKNESNICISPLTRKAMLKIASSSIDFDSSEIKVQLGDQPEANIGSSYCIDLPTIEACSEIMVQGTIRMMNNAGYLIKTEIIVEIYLHDIKNLEDPNPCIVKYPV